MKLTNEQSDALRKELGISITHMFSSNPLPDLDKVTRKIRGTKQHKCAQAFFAVDSCRR